MPPTLLTCLAISKMEMEIVKVSKWTRTLQLLDQDLELLHDREHLRR